MRPLLAWSILLDSTIKWSILKITENTNISTEVKAVFYKE